MSSIKPAAIYLKDYAATPFVISHVDMNVVLDATATQITTRIIVAPRTGGDHDLVFDGEGLTLISLAVDGKALNAASYRHGADKLAITGLPKTAPRPRPSNA